MTRMEEMMVETYCTLIQNGQQTAVPNYLPDAVRQAVADKRKNENSDQVTTE